MSFSSSPSGAPSSGPSPREEIEALPWEELARRISESLDIADQNTRDIIRESVAQMEEKEPKRRKEMEELLVAAERLYETMELKSSIHRRRDPLVHALVLDFGAALAVRQKLLHEVLGALNGAREGASGNAFVDIGGERGVPDIVLEMENHAYSPPDIGDTTGDENPLFLGNDFTRPNFRTIHTYKEQCDWILDPDRGIIDTAATPEEQALTRKRILELRSALDTIERVNPQQAARWATKDMVGKLTGFAAPVRLLAFGAISFLAIVSAVLTIRKIAKGEKLSAGDLLTPAYIAAALVLAGVPILGKSDNDLMRIGNTALAIRNNPIRNVVKKLGLDKAKASVLLLAELLQDSSEDGGKERLAKLFKEHRYSISHEAAAAALNDAGGEALVNNLKDLTPLERWEFLARLKEMNIHDEDKLDEALIVISAPDLYA